MRLGAEAKHDAPVAINLSQQMRQAGARTFYNDGNNWVDGDLTKPADARRVQINSAKDLSSSQSKRRLSRSGRKHAARARTEPPR
jgi:serine/threonine protein kinase HipA of HipAB toxin-antitoxin module